MNAEELVAFIRETYRTSEFIPLHAPRFLGNENKYLAETIDSTFVSSVGQYVDRFERMVEDFTGSTRAVSTVNGTAALQTALYMAGVQPGDLVITQSLTFVATCNVIHHLGATPVLCDVSPVSLGLCPSSVNDFLRNSAHTDGGVCRLNSTGQIIRSVVPMHTFGHPVELNELEKLCEQWKITLVEDAAESLGSLYEDCHTGTIGSWGALSFNGNKIITTGGGGMVLCADSEGGARAKHLTTTAKVTHDYEFVHDEPGFNFRLPNLNAALGCAQMESLPEFLEKKRALASKYRDFFAGSPLDFVEEPEYATSNFWLNAVICEDRHRRDELLSITNNLGIMTRPAWTPMHQLPMYRNCIGAPLDYTESICDRILNLPSSVP